jgi:hypothetical protein
MDLMTDTCTLSCDAFPVEGGHLVVPASLPFYVPNAALPLSVGEWLGVEPPETVSAS